MNENLLEVRRMFLNELKKENKELFLDLCYLAALSNEIMEEEEREMIYAYCREMNISEKIPELKENLEQITEHLEKNASEKEKNIIILEILGLLRADGVYDEKEREFMITLQEGLKVKEKKVEQLSHLLDTYTSICNDLYLTICE